MLLYTIPYQDHHLIGNLLLRNGRLASLLFYGGRGGGKKGKCTPLEIGTMLVVELSISRKTVELYKALEWSSLWAPQKMRHDYKAFTLMGLYLEVVRKISLPENLSENFGPASRNISPQCRGAHEGLFSVLSNALFHLERALLSGRADTSFELCLFLGKLLIEQGIFPERRYCGPCQRPFLHSEGGLPRPFLSFEEGAFLCSRCVPPQRGAKSVPLWEFLGVVAYHKYQKIVPRDFKLEQLAVMATILFHYFCFQFHLREKDFKALSFVL